ncbi:MAG: Mu transposase C-terminal domain-containing protein [Planctomycetia bacterium]|nr:Mu transposase C-terminal domain-containing protein [Planctomycetia bacterium]
MTAGASHKPLSLYRLLQPLCGRRTVLSQTNLDILIDSLIRAWTIHGSPKRTLPRQCQGHHSDALRSACYNLGIKLIHRPPRDPAPGGLVERFFGTSQTQFESEVRSGDIITLDAINQAFSAYLAVVYHARIHSETNQSPKQRYDEGLTVIRHVDMDAALAFFMKRIPRTVDRTFADVRIDNRFYRVDPKLRGDKVEVRYDPYGDLKKVLIYSANGEYLGSEISTCATRALKLQPPHLQNQNIITSTLSLRNTNPFSRLRPKALITTKSSPNDPGHSWHSSRNSHSSWDTKALSPPSALMNSNRNKNATTVSRSQRIIAHGAFKMPP